MRSLLAAVLSLTLFAAACGDDGAGSAADWCDLATEIDATGDVGTGTPDDWRNFRDLVNEASRSAPDEIADDVDTLSSWLDAMVEALDDNDDNVLLAFDQVALSGDFSEDELDAASDAITAYNEAECGLPDNDSGDSDAGNSDAGDSDAGDSDSGIPEGGDAGIPEGGIVAGIADSLGIPEEDARCILENVDLSESGEPDPAQIFDALDICDIDPLSIAGG
jgi:hypothetical protein